MIWIQGESDDEYIIVCLLSDKTESVSFWNCDYSINLMEYTPKFLKLKSTDFDITPPKDKIYVVSCNGTELVYGDNLWNKIDKPGICFHIGDQIYNDSLYNKWKKEPFDGDEIKKEYYKQYYDAWEKLSLYKYMNIFVPDDHEINDDTYYWSSKNSLDKFFGELCINFYLSFRINTWKDYPAGLLPNSSIIGDLNYTYVHNNDTIIVVNQRFTKPLFSDVPNIDEYKKIIWISSASVVPYYTLDDSEFYKDKQYIDGYNLLYDKLIDKQSILIGGDIHLYMEGYIHKKLNYIPFYISSPINNNTTDIFGSEYRLYDSNYKIQITDIKKTALNVLEVNLNTFKVNHYYTDLGYIKTITNIFYYYYNKLLSCGV